ncbi:hypothetical protein AAFF_G00113590 [Aldrovandia affinis]|uniref:Uncharacterized protein n=1 Tax=Aldrovandia affinis TaxID=143900 RepID=A0AAD7RTI6_9TELE|nr:hypothetical protein AAFF_G00113590 [Aldrovandia affinis]
MGSDEARDYAAVRTLAQGGGGGGNDALKTEMTRQGGRDADKMANFHPARLTDLGERGGHLYAPLPWADVTVRIAWKQRLGAVGGTGAIATLARRVKYVHDKDGHRSEDPYFPTNQVADKESHDPTPFSQDKPPDKEVQGWG